MLTRRSVVTGLAVLAANASRIALAEERVVRMGYQKVGAFALLKAHGLLNQQLEPLGYTVAWQEFPGGPQLLAALKDGAVDFAHSGEAPPIFAQAADTPLLYIGYVPDGPLSEAILVPKDSPIRTIADLKGKKIGLNRGSNVHYLLVRVLAKAGVKYADVDPVFLTPAEGRAAFEKGAIDAWVIWEPYRTAAEFSLGARTLADGTGLVSNNDFFFVAKAFALAHPQLIDLIFGATRAVFAQAAKDIPGTAKTFSAAAGFPVAVLETTLSHRGFNVQRINEEVIGEQQRIADTFKDIELIPNSIIVSDAVYRPTSQRH